MLHLFILSWRLKNKTLFLSYYSSGGIGVHDLGSLNSKTVHMFYGIVTHYQWSCD